MSVLILIKLTPFCEWFTTKHKRTGTSTRYCQDAVGLGEGLSEWSVGCVYTYEAMVIFFANILASMLLEAA